MTESSIPISNDPDQSVSANTSASVPAPSPADADLWIFRDGRRTVSGAAMLRDLQRRLVSRNDVLDALIQAGELEEPQDDRCHGHGEHEPQPQLDAPRVHPAGGQVAGLDVGVRHGDPRRGGTRQHGTEQRGRLCRQYRLIADRALEIRERALVVGFTGPLDENLRRDLAEYLRQFFRALNDPAGTARWVLFPARVEASLPARCWRRCRARGLSDAAIASGDRESRCRRDQASASHGYSPT